MNDIIGPPCPYRAVGFTWAAGLFPLSKGAQGIVAEHNGVAPEKLSHGARFAPNEGMRAWMDALGKRYAETGALPRIGNRWMLPGELA